MTYIPDISLQFLRDLRENNHREWFQTHKNRYTSAHESVKAFASQLVDAMSLHDEIEGVKIFRIYRDVRFSKDKTPYKTSFSGGLKRATMWRRGGYYFHIEPGGKSLVAGGFWNPNSADIKRIRQEFAADPDPFRKIITSTSFQKTFGKLEGEQVKSAPKGYKKDHPSIDLLRYKQFLVYHYFSDEAVCSPDFLEKVVNTYQQMLPFFDYMSTVLTTDANGVPIAG